VAAGTGRASRVLVLPGPPGGFVIPAASHSASGTLRARRAVATLGLAPAGAAVPLGISAARSRLACLSCCALAGPAVPRVALLIVVVPGVVVFGVAVRR
jgi:hypothetical protein